MEARRTHQLRIVARLRDGRVHSGYTPAFDPTEGSIWCSPMPDSPSGTVITLTRIKILLILGDAGVLPPSSNGQPGQRLRIEFPDGDAFIGRQTAELPGLGHWLQPVRSGSRFARAFVPVDAGAILVEMREELRGGETQDEEENAPTWPDLEIEMALAPTPLVDVPTVELLQSRPGITAPSLDLDPNDFAEEPTRSQPVPELSRSESAADTQPIPLIDLDTGPTHKTEPDKPAKT